MGDTEYEFGDHAEVLKSHASYYHSHASDAFSSGHYICSHLLRSFFSNELDFNTKLLVIICLISVSFEMVILCTPNFIKKRLVHFDAAEGSFAKTGLLSLAFFIWTALTKLQ